VYISVLNLVGLHPVAAPDGPTTRTRPPAQPGPPDGGQALGEHVGD
jgi:hypothetical protein